MIEFLRRLLNLEFQPVDNWHQHEFHLFSRIPSDEQGKLPHNVMRRKVDGEWQYRRMTDEEDRTYAAGVAW